MITIITIILITTIWCLGVRIVTHDGMALNKWREYGDQKVKEGKRIFEPLFICEWCMPSMHSLIGYFFTWMIGLLPIKAWAFLCYPLVVAGASYLTGMLWLLLELLNSILIFYINKNESHGKNKEPRQEFQELSRLQ